MLSATIGVPNKLSINSLASGEFEYAIIPTKTVEIKKDMVKINKGLIISLVLFIFLFFDKKRFVLLLRREKRTEITFLFFFNNSL